MPAEGYHKRRNEKGTKKNHVKFLLRCEQKKGRKKGKIDNFEVENAFSCATRLSSHEDGRKGGIFSPNNFFLLNYL